MSTLPTNLYTAEQARQLDRMAIQDDGISGQVLMERAGHSTFMAIKRFFPRAKKLVVLCGSGNNGGDGYVIARLARTQAYDVRVQTPDGAQAPVPGSEASAARQRALEAGVPEGPLGAGDLTGAELVIDALLGTGLSREVAGPWRTAIEAINKSGRPVLAVDIPSGLDADRGRVLGVAVCADVTVSFIGLKLGLLTGAGPDQAGRIVYSDLELPPGVLESVQPAGQRLDGASLPARLPPRRGDAHKGQFGHVLVVGGQAGMSGAPAMAAAAAARSGAGLVTVATTRDSVAAVASARPELMVHRVDEPGGLLPLLRQATLVALGPGLGQADWGQAMATCLFDQHCPLVVDADGLNLLAQNPLHRDDWILTPHPGEAARLLQTSVRAVQDDRPAAVREIAHRYGGCCVLKGTGSLIAQASGPLYLCDRGNPAMASGGMGDVLTGIVAALAAQGLGRLAAASLGVYVHATAADHAARGRGVGLLASDLFDHLPGLLSDPV